MTRRGVAVVASLLLVAVLVLTGAGAASVAAATEATTLAPLTVDAGNATANGTDCTRVDTQPDGQQVCVKVVRDWNFSCIASIGGCAAAGWLIFGLTLPCLLLALGFGVIGVAAGSLAALFQSGFGTPCCFSVMQSVAMQGSPLSARMWYGVVGIVLGTVGGYYWLPLCFVEEQYPLPAGTPSPL